MNKKSRICLFFVVILSMAALSIGIHKPLNNSKISDSSCILEDPLRALYGYFVPMNEVSGPKKIMYYVHYIGKHKETGGVCTERKIVTKSEYERLMSRD